MTSSKGVIVVLEVVGVSRLLATIAATFDLVVRLLKLPSLYLIVPSVLILVRSLAVCVFIIDSLPEELIFLIKCAFNLVGSDFLLLVTSFLVTAHTETTAVAHFY